MERCSYCGEPIRGTPVEFGDEIFCSEECLDQLETREDDEGHCGDDDYGGGEYGDDDSRYADF